MSIEETVLEKLHALPLERQQEVLDFAEFLYLKLHQPGTAQAIAETDSIWDLGTEPIRLNIPDAAENHDAYLYNLD
jgi:hypothetical protein